MLIFDEKIYAEELIKNKKYQTVKTQGRERCVLVRYLNSLGYNKEKIKKVLFDIPIHGGEYLSYQDKDIIFDKIINKANDYEFVTGITVNIFKSEINEIEQIENKYERYLLFMYLVYYKWASKVKHLQFYSKKNNIMMVVENNNDLWKLAGVSKFKVSDRYMLCNQLFNKGLYKIDNFKNHNYIYLPFAKNDGEIVISISKYDNILGELLIYEEPNNYKRCAICGRVITKTRSPKKYCSECAYKENIRKTMKNRKSLKSKSL